MRRTRNDWVPMSQCYYCNLELKESYKFRDIFTCIECQEFLRKRPKSTNRQDDIDYIQECLRKAHLRALKTPHWSDEELKYVSDNFAHEIQNLLKEKKQTLQRLGKQYSKRGDCSYCKQPFISNRPWQLYCSPECRKANWARDNDDEQFTHVERRRSRDTKCIQCEKEFNAYTSKQIYCSLACKQRAYRQRKILR